MMIVDLRKAASVVLYNSATVDALSMHYPYFIYTLSILYLCFIYALSIQLTRPKNNYTDYEINPIVVIRITRPKKRHIKPFHLQKV
ncbi:hypothetical protein B0I10_101336 [Flavobacterium lacus]|uniref:Uncharacterized protein n=1 Tax=Flavobacterium lacus TaxID=1353778 RepID=A0A328WXU5_9FLAO|nr:hypothetical protein B0I10_101336 [Flavobacterium lacus]